MVKRNMLKAEEIEKKREENQTTNPQKKLNDEKENAKLIINYMGNKTKKLRKRLKPYKVQIVNKKRKNLEEHFASNYKYRTENGKGIIYKIYCECGANYIGESSTDFEKRKYQHMRDLKTKSDSNAIFKHCFEEDHLVNWNMSTLLDMEGLKIRRKLKEAIIIKDQKPQINISEGFKIRGNWELK